MSFDIVASVRKIKETKVVFFVNGFYSSTIYKEKGSMFGNGRFSIFVWTWLFTKKSVGIINLQPTWSNEIAQKTFRACDRVTKNVALMTNVKRHKNSKHCLLNCVRISSTTSASCGPKRFATVFQTSTPLYRLLFLKCYVKVWKSNITNILDVYMKYDIIKMDFKVN